jgi:phosphotriesterase-related protein
MDVMTVRGPVRGDALGLTLPHEHLFLDLFRITRVRDGLLNDETLAIQEAARFKAAGGATLVEVTNHGLRRNPAAMRRVAEATGLHVVMGSGWYREPYYDHDYIARRTTADLAADFVAEIEKGDP